MTDNNQPIGRLQELLDQQRLRIRKLIEDITSKLWFLPAIWMTGASILALIIIIVDRSLLPEEFWQDMPWFLLSEPDSARTLLGAIATSMLTVTSLAFSLMMVTVVQTANAFSPRILRQFIADRHNQNVLGILLGTFLFSLITLRAIQGGFAPLIAVNVATLLAVISTIALVSFITRVAESIKVSEVSGLILADTQAVIDAPFVTEVGIPWPHADDGNNLLDDKADVLAHRSGYVQLLNSEELLELAQKENLTITLVQMPGDYVLDGAPVAKIQPSAMLTESIGNAVRDALVLSRERTYSQDVRYGLRQLSDIAVRALSPGINDPSTAVDTIHAISLLLAAIIEHDTPVPLRSDATGALRLIFPKLTLADCLNEGLGGILHYGSTDFATMQQLIQTVGQLRYITKTADDQDALWDFLERIVAAAKIKFEFSAERQLLNNRLQDVVAIFASEKTVSLVDDAS